MKIIEEEKLILPKGYTTEIFGGKGFTYSRESYFIASLDISIL